MAVTLSASLEAKLTTALERSVQPRMEKAVSEGLGAITQAATSLPPLISSSVTTGVKATVSAAVKEHFSATLVPGYEKAAQAMFEQLHATFTSGLSQLVSDVQAPLTEVLTNAAAQAAVHQEQVVIDATSKLDAAIKKAAGEMTGTARKAANEAKAAAASQAQATLAPVPQPQKKPPSAPSPAPSPAPTPAPASAPAPAPPPDVLQSSGVMQNFALTMELQGLVAQAQVERAFAVALNANNTEIVLWLCNQLEPKTLGGPTPVSQLVLVSLVAQLVNGLHTEPVKLKLGWLREALGLLNTADPLIAPNIDRILASVQEQLSRAEALLDPSHPSTADLALVIFKVNKMCQQRR